MTNLRVEFDTLNYYKGIEDYARKTGNPVPEAVKEHIVEHKRKLRHELRRRQSSRKPRVYEKEECCKSFWEETFPSKEAAQKWVEENFVNIADFYPFSPTGLWFTSDLRVAHKTGDTYLVYKQENFDC